MLNLRSSLDEQIYAISPAVSNCQLSASVDPRSGMMQDGVFEGVSDPSRSACGDESLGLSSICVQVYRSVTLASFRVQNSGT